MNIVFRQHLKIFLKDILYLEKRVVDGIEKCITDKQLAEHLINHGADIAEALEVDVQTDCSDCWSKDNRIDELEDQMVKWDTMDEERKFEAYMEFHGKFNAQQMHDLLS